jgi:hypothetical protein
VLKYFKPLNFESIDKKIDKELNEKLLLKASIFNYSLSAFFPELFKLRGSFLTNYFKASGSTKNLQHFFILSRIVLRENYFVPFVLNSY